MKVFPRVQARCFECEADTLWWLIDVRVNRSRSCFASRGNIKTYRCSECGVEEPVIP